MFTGTSGITATAERLETADSITWEVKWSRNPTAADAKEFDVWMKRYASK